MSQGDKAPEIALAFLRRFWEADIDGAMSYVAADARWQFARSLPYERDCDVRTALTAIRNDMFKSFDTEGFTIDMRSVANTGDEVAVEYSAHGKTRDGRDYDNDYVMCITVNAGKITSVRPHTDTLHLAQLLMKEPTGAE